jgi:hypothetical protein
MEGVLFGLNDRGRLIHAERTGSCDIGELQTLAAKRLVLFPVVEVWVESVRVVTVARAERGDPPAADDHDAPRALRA